MPHYLGGLVIAGVVGGLAALASRYLFSEPFRNAPQRDARGAAILRYGRGFWSLGIVCGIVIPSGLLFVQMIHPSQRAGQLPWLVGIAATFALIGAWLLAAAARVWARVGADGVEARSIMGHTQFLAWVSIANVRYSTWRGALVFTGTDGVRARVPIMAVGLPLLLDEMAAHLPIGLYEEAVTRGLTQLRASAN